ncbi:anthranilate synthase component II [Streptomyces iakyrus]|uniref:Anthranilate synthase component II n=1 Tax=Streptomyces iakyrus TaxID=68219 RepID=A0ABW8FBS7_9ACTN
MKVLLVDAYDSFVHIIDRYLRSLGAATEVVRSGSRSPRELTELAPDAVVLGPGPGHPVGSGHVELVHTFAGRVPLLGVCLGHQAVALAYGGQVTVAEHLMHGRTSTLSHDGAGVFRGAPDEPVVTRYHSLVVREPLPDVLEVTARSTDDGYVMGLRHRTLPVEGVQFHPESVETHDGLAMLDNFLDLAAGRHAIRAGAVAVRPATSA